jgi:hypothetical protein
MKTLFSAKFALIFIFMLSLLMACKKEPGKGGRAAIKGVLYSKSVGNVNSVARPELEADVYIIYGEDNTYSDRVRTSGDGSFTFKFLQPGNYKLYAFGLDPAFPNGNSLIAFYKEVKVGSNKAIVEVTDFVIYKKINGGTNTITGKLISKNAFNASNYSPQGINDYLPEANEDVFISYDNTAQFDDRVRTSADGSFEFNQLQDGIYTIYAYSKDTTGPFPTGNVAISKTVVVSGKNTINNSGNLLVYKVNGGTNRISGQLISRNINNYGTNFNDSIQESGDDVYLVYGNGFQSYDKVTTAPDGTFEFNGLRSGNYRIFAYSMDTANGSSSDIPISKLVNLNGNNINQNLGSLVIYKEADRGGSSVITGRIFARHFNPTFTQFQYQGPEPDQDVYIKYGNGTLSYDDRVITDGNGNFQFKDLRQGIYTVYSLSDTVVIINNGLIKKSKIATITVAKSQVNIGDIRISKN